MDKISKETCCIVIAIILVIVLLFIFYPAESFNCAPGWKWDMSKKRCGRVMENLGGCRPGQNCEHLRACPAGQHWTAMYGCRSNQEDMHAKKCLAGTKWNPILKQCVTKTA